MTGAQSDTAAEVIGRLEIETGQPMDAMLEISDHCNEVCVHCYQIQGQKREMGTEQVFRVMEDLAAAGILILTISGGEATLRPDFLDIVRYARKLGFLIRLFTNGLRVDEAMARALGELAVETVEISLYSHVAETHDFVTGVPGSFVKTVAGIRALVSHRVPVVVKTPAMSVNEHQLDGYQEFVASLGARLRLSSGDLLPREGGTGEPWALNPGRNANLSLQRKLSEAKVQPGGEQRSANSRSCGAGRVVHVEANGELRPCSVLELNLGNLTEQGLRETQAKSQTLSGLTSLRFSDLHGCRACEISGHCGRCYAKALAETGDALGPQPSACAIALVRYEAQHGVALAIENAVSDSPCGPFEVTGEHRARAVPDRVSPQDDALAERLGWTRRAAQPANESRANPGELVQLRRPGQKKPLQLRVPSGVEGQGD